MKNLKEYYRHVGRLAYVVAMADGAIQPEEREQLQNSVIRDFAANENNVDSSGMNEAFYMNFAFEEALTKKEDKDLILRNFSMFLENSCDAGDKELLNRSLELLKKIARAYTKNKEELVIETVSNKINKALQKN